jgi:diguanylate cyclase (GGDEF)-like protein/PAS domain S-box-containing protein
VFVYLATVVAIAAAYFASARLGLHYVLAGTGITPVWPPAGIALAVVFLGGWRMLPAVALGALAADATVAPDLGATLGITAANLVEVTIGVALLRRSGFRPSLERVRDVLSLTCFAGLLATAVGAAVGIGSLLAVGAIAHGDAGRLWRSWWLGDLSGVVLVGGTLFALWARGRDWLAPHRLAVAGAAALLVGALGLLLLHDRATVYLLLPVLVAMALLLRQAGGIVGALIVALLAVWFTDHGHGPFLGAAADTDLLRAQTFVTVGGVTALLVAAMRSEHAVTKSALRRLDESSLALAEAQRLTNVGSANFHALVQNAPYALLVFDRGGRITLVNRQAEQLFGLDAAAATGERLDRLIPPSADATRPWFSNVFDRGEESRAIEVEALARRADGHEFPVEVSLSLLESEGGQLISAAIRDVTELKEAAEALTHRASHDPLTGLPNRTVFLDRLEQALARARRTHRPLAVIFLDLDDFKTINDTHGHGTGDLLLVGLTPRLRAAVRPGDTIARFGGDEFVVLCEEVGDEAAAGRLTERITAAAGARLTIGGRELGVSVSAGLVLVSGPGDATAADVLRDADAAMYRAKRAGKDKVVVFDEGMRERLVERLELESALRQARSRGQLRLVYQPVFSLDERRIVAVEALLRWQHPVHGELRPADFFGVAESGSLIVEIGEWAIEEACRQAVVWRDTTHDREPLQVSVNVSPWHLARSDVAAAVERILAATGLEPELLALEITEGALLQNERAATRALQELKAMGVRLVLDDFGTGYHSIGNLRRFTIDGVKLDRAFVGGLGADGEDPTVVSAVLSMAHALDVGVTAGGVETPTQLARLRRHGCMFAQGYLLAPPSTAEEVATLFHQEVPPPLDPAATEALLTTFRGRRERSPLVRPLSRLAHSGPDRD